MEDVIEITCRHIGDGYMLGMEYVTIPYAKYKDVVKALSDIGIDMEKVHPFVFQAEQQTQLGLRDAKELAIINADKFNI